MTADRFPPDVLASLEQTDEVDIEPRSADAQRVRPVTIWIVVVDGEAYVRSFRGPQGRWYSSLLRHPPGVLHAGGREISFQAVRVEDRPTIDRVSDAYRRKYGDRWPKETADMLVDEVLPTTLRLEGLVTQGA